MSYTNGLDKPTDYFNTKIYTGDGTSPRSITGVGFQPDWVWTKNRSGTNGHVLYDSVRGVSAGELSTHNSNAEGLATQYGEMTSFDSDGYTFQDGVTNGVVFNNSGNNYVSWSWRGSDSSAVSNTDGSITSTVSANTTSGFSIVSYSGSNSNSTVGHSLGTAPKVIFVKRRNTADNWRVLHMSLGNATTGHLNLTDAFSSSGVFQNTSPTSSVFSLVGNNTSVNQSGSTYIAYCFAEKQGYSKFGSYVGNGNADGTFVYTGFKPAFVMLKDTANAGDWTIQDSARDTFNLADARLYANLNNSENDGSLGVDFLSNGIKIRTSSAGWNTSGNTYIYMAFAEEPLVGDNPATAR